MDLRDGIDTLSMDGKTNCACLPGLGAEQRRRVAYYAVLPNLLLMKSNIAVSAKAVMGSEAN